MKQVFGEKNSHTVQYQKESWENSLKIMHCNTENKDF